MANRQSLSQAVVKQGYLRKAPSTNKFAASFKKTWARRWFVFGVRSHVGPYLEYYNNEDSIFTSPPIKSIGLNRVSHVAYSFSGNTYQFSISITLPDRLLILAALNRAEMFQWYHAIKTKLSELGILQDRSATLSHVTMNQYAPLPTLERAQASRNNHIPEATQERSGGCPELPVRPETDEDNSSYDFASVSEVIANKRNEEIDKDSDDSDDDYEKDVFDTPYENTPIQKVKASKNAERVYENSWINKTKKPENSHEADGVVMRKPKKVKNDDVTPSANESVKTNKGDTTEMKLTSDFLDLNIEPSGVNQKANDINDNQTKSHPYVNVNVEQGSESEFFFGMNGGKQKDKALVAKQISVKKAAKNSPLATISDNITATTEETYETIWNGNNNVPPSRLSRQSKEAHVPIEQPSSRQLSFVSGTTTDETRQKTATGPHYVNDPNGFEARLERKLSQIEDDFDKRQTDNREEEPPPPYSPPDGANAYVPGMRPVDESQDFFIINPLATGEGANGLPPYSPVDDTKPKQEINYHRSEPQRLPRRQLSLHTVVKAADTANGAAKGRRLYVNQGQDRHLRYSASTVESGGSRPYENSILGRQQSITLRQSQIEMLQQEMSHASGIKVSLRHVDCFKGMALVDCIGAVWLAGWNLKEHPYLHGAFHIGDQLVSVNGMVIQTAHQAQKIIKHLDEFDKVIFIIRRVPHAKVFAVRRQAEGQTLGIKRDGGLAEIVHVEPDGLAAGKGLTCKAQGLDGSSLTNWTLTEINNRPLNLFFKENEIEHRLNAVGKDISIMVQPSDFVKLLKKQLKTIRNYKDYIVQ